MRSPHDRLVRAGLLACVLAGLTGALLWGCARRSPVQASNAEARLTSGRGLFSYPFVSPNGKWIAYTGKPEAPGSIYCAYLQSVAGGDPRVLDMDSTNVHVYHWAGDSQALYLYRLSDRRLVKVDLEGRLLETYPAYERGKVIDISPDESTFLCLQFNGDNYDVATAPAGGDSTAILNKTPAWEVDARYGPGPRHITVVRQASYEGPSSEIVVWNLEGALPEERPLPLPEAMYLSPSWSSDGRFLAYSSNQEGDADLWILDRATDRTIQVTTGPEEDFHPSWSPDGTWLAYTRRVRTLDIFVADPLTNEKKQLTQGGDRDIFPLLSPDGKWVAFVRETVSREVARTPGRLCVVPADGGEVSPIDIGDLGIRPGMMSWAPDGSQIAFAADDGTGNLDIYRVERAGGSPVRVTLGPAEDLIPAWSPDGEHIAFTRLSGETQIWVIPAMGGIAHQVTTHGGINQASVWGPDSDHLAYLSMITAGGCEIRVGQLSHPEESRVQMVSAKPCYPDGFDGENIIVWKQGEDLLFTPWALSMSTGAETQLGTPHRDANARNFLVDLNEEGKRLVEVLFPGGRHAYADGDLQADVYRVDVDGFLRTGFPPAE